jgi:hypothetical protein
MDYGDSNVGTEKIENVSAECQKCPQLVVATRRVATMIDF